MPSKQRGVALIVVLLIVAMVAIIATNITSRNQLSVRRTLNMAQYDQAFWYAISAEEIAKKVLKQDLEDSDTVHLQQYWALADVIFPAEKGEIAGKITDMRACFNINSLSAPSEKVENGQPKMPLPAVQFKGLLVALGMDEFAAERLAQTTKDYIDEDTVSSPYGAEDAEYESRNVPYRAANTLMSHKSELRAVMGFTQDIYLKLAPYVCAIPGNTTQVLNVNTVPVEHAAIIAGMFDNKISVGEAESIINQRPIDGYDDINEFWENSSVASLAGDAKLKSSFGVTSKYFQLDAAAKVDTAVFRLESVLYGDSKKLEVLSRQFGGQK
ncbi:MULTISPECIES: type II secretion system minor pseudopilin GspK [Shewanella]|uniref:Type II secretion system protein K n=1 Tax=Shewanella fidelis TaxID=173509 RepID=A0AAW8NVL7_9GAMM|nr:MULTISPECIES: type II secretion system minor pseudopilin GspK [Shewanella]MDR8525999.1 type II secretion system minor pseudopilin GspK [Shewanella fidelis]MDW4813813.1 type II secretion system minor pseudopilin GspK [Shewanella fidelis]MDW4817995.1 type II secretion system minor pseudopilin GspK [Shewanella fidelis]MDW4822062.1 type II secretion system minor pseudopilin GspK [Shewanella fidelis]MDW4826227.1 type II secretion system minor pseudopilin GspK [Shewanella fidelis]